MNSDKPSNQTVAQVILLLHRGTVGGPDLNDRAVAGETLLAWKAALFGVEDEELQQAAVLYLQSGEKWFPAASQIRLIAKPPPPDDSELSWGDVRARVRSAPVDSPPWKERGERIVNRAIYPDDEERDEACRLGVRACGGWRALCMMETEKVPTFRNSFKSAYQAHMHRVRGRHVTQIAQETIALLATSEATARLIENLGRVTDRRAHAQRAAAIAAKKYRDD